MSEYETEEERYHALKSYLMDFSLKGTSWYNKLYEYLNTIRIHIGKINLFSPVVESYELEYWINEICKDIRTVIAMKDTTWRIDSRVFKDYIDTFIEGFNNVVVLNAALRSQYSGLVLSLLSNSGRNLNTKKEISDRINKNSRLCDEVFINCMKIISDTLSNKKNLTKNTPPEKLMNLIKPLLRDELVKLTK